MLVEFGNVAARGIKIALLQVKQELVHNQFANGVMAVIGTLVNFWLHSFQIDLILFLLLIGVVAMNTLSGVLVSKKNGSFNSKILKKTVFEKMVGYVCLLVMLGLLISMMFLGSKLDDKQLFSNLVFNAPGVITLIFFAGAEFRSFLENANTLGWKVPGFVKRIPDHIEKEADQFFK